MTYVVIAMPGNETLADGLAAQLNLERVAATMRRFPDGESMVRAEAPFSCRSHTPVLVDDIVSTAYPMIETVGHLRRAGLAQPVWMAMHAIFAQTAYDDLRAAGTDDIVSRDTITHPSNRITLTPARAYGLREFMEQERIA